MIFNTFYRSLKINYQFTIQLINQHSQNCLNEKGNGVKILQIIFPIHSHFFEVKLTIHKIFWLKISKLCSKPVRRNASNY